MAEKYWHEIPKHFPFVKLDAFVVMPNHVYEIIITNKNDGVSNNNTNNNTNDNSNDKHIVETPKLGVSTTAAATSTTVPIPAASQIGNPKH